MVTCDTFRSSIEKSLFGQLSADDRKLLEEHMAGCANCRGYLDELKRDDLRMREYAELFASDIEDVRGAVSASLQAGDGRTITEETSRRSGGTKRSFSWWKAAVWIGVAAVLILIGLRAGIFEPSSGVFATVLEKIGRAEDVSYRTTYQIEGMEPFSTHDMISSRGNSRKELASGSVVIHIPREGKQLTLHHGSRRATLIHRLDAAKREGLLNYLDWIENLHRGEVTFAGREKVGETVTNLFINDEDPYYIMRVWSDVETDLPVRAEFVSTPNPASDVIVPTLVLYKSSFGSPSSESRAISYSASGGITIPATVVMDEFEWNIGLDESLFSLNPPGWYALEEDTLDVTESAERDLVQALELWTSMSEGAFPDDINDLANQEKANPLLVAAFDGDGDPEREFDEAMKAANVLLKGCLFAQEMKVAGFWEYRGKGVSVGEDLIPVCWWGTEDDEEFRILYGDLRVEDIGEKDLPE